MNAKLSNFSELSNILYTLLPYIYNYGLREEILWIWNHGRTIWEYGGRSYSVDSLETSAILHRAFFGEVLCEHLGVIIDELEESLIKDDEVVSAYLIMAKAIEDREQTKNAAWNTSLLFCDKQNCRMLHSYSQSIWFQRKKFSTEKVLIFFTFVSIFSLKYDMVKNEISGIPRMWMPLIIFRYLSELSQKRSLFSLLLFQIFPEVSQSHISLL